jgi:hypothetical protein
MSGLRNNSLANVVDGDTKATFLVSTQPARDAVQRDKDNPRSSLIPDGNYLIACRAANYVSKRKDGTKLAAPRLKARWEVFDANGKSLGTFTEYHGLPVQLKEGDKYEGSNQFWAKLKRSLLEYEGEQKLNEFLGRDETAISPEWLVGKSGYAHLAIEANYNKKGQHTEVKYFLGKAEFATAPGPSAGDGTVPPKTDGPPEVAGGDDSYADGGGYDDSDVPF